MGKTVLFVSGKGGVGKSTLSSALAMAAADAGKRVALLDGDIGLRSLDMMLGLQDKVLFDLADVIDGRSSLENALVWHPVTPSLRLLVLGQQSKPKDFNRKDLRKILATLARRYDLVFVDGPAGLGRGVRNFAGLTDEVVIVSTPDPVSIRSAEKTASQLYPQGIRPWLLLNRYQPEKALEGAVDQPSALSLALDLPLLGVLEETSQVNEGLLTGKTAYQTGGAPVKEALAGMLKRLEGASLPVDDYQPIRLNLFQRIWKWLEK